MSTLIPEKLPDSVETVIENVSAPVTKSLGKTLDSLFYLTFGWIDNLAAKQKIKNDLKLEQFGKLMHEKFDAIPEDCREEPDLQIAGQILSKSIYCLSHDELQELFANLLASSIDSRKQSLVQPCFADMLSQMTPLDAQNIQLYKSSCRLPIISIDVSLDASPQQGYARVFENIFLSNKIQADLNKQSVSISSLERFGLIRVDYSLLLVDANLYSEIENSDIFKELCKQIKKSLERENKGGKLNIVRGLTALTPLGEAFLNAVTPDDPDIVSQLSE